MANRPFEPSDGRLYDLEKALVNVVDRLGKLERVLAGHGAHREALEKEWIQFRSTIREELVETLREEIQRCWESVVPGAGSTE
jgi:hypothetical protein